MNEAGIGDLEVEVDFVGLSLSCGVRIAERTAFQDIDWSLSAGWWIVVNDGRRSVVDNKGDKKDCIGSRDRGLAIHVAGEVDMAKRKTNRGLIVWT